MDENEKETTQPQEVEEVETTEEVEETEEVTTEASEEKPKETPEARLARLERQAEQLRKKLGIKPEEKKEEPKAKPSKPKAQDFSVEAKILKVAKGLSNEEIERAEKIAQIEGIDLADAVTHDLFTSWKEKRDKEADAELRASKGGATKRKEKTLSTPNLSRDEHKALFQKAMRN